MDRVEPHGQGHANDRKVSEERRLPITLLIGVCAAVGTKRLTLNDVLMSIGAMTIVLTMLIVFDSQVREEVAGRVWRSPEELASARFSAHNVTRYVVQVVKAECQQHLVLMMFVIAASVLTLFMIRI
jgi:hypothetical protein